MTEFEVKEVKLYSHMEGLTSTEGPRGGKGGIRTASEIICWQQP